MSDKDILSAAELREEGLDDWIITADALRTRLRTKNFVTGLRLINLIGEAAEEANHHPDLDLRYPHVDITLSSHDVGGLTARDVRMARKISEIAAAEDITAAPDTLHP